MTPYPKNRASEPAGSSDRRSMWSANSAGSRTSRLSLAPPNSRSRCGTPRLPARWHVGALALSIWRAPFVPCMIRGIGDRGEFHGGLA